jgi:predicted nuclease of predicted toxin-antitoxin system
MKVLLDESLPRALKHEFRFHNVLTVPEMGWAGKDNGELLRLASEDFDVFVTADQGLQYQQNLAGFDIAVVTLAARTNRVEDLKPLIPKLLASLPDLEEGKVITIAG